MIPRFLFPHRFKRMGWILTAVFLALGIGCMYFDVEFSFLNVRLPFYSGDWPGRVTENLTNTLAALGLLAGLVLTAFSREEQEDEYLAHIRQESLLWAVYVNYLLLALAILIFYGTDFLDVMVYNLFTVLIIYIIRFNLLITSQKRQLRHAK